MFDSSVARGQPAEFGHWRDRRLGEALQLMPVGSAEALHSAGSGLRRTRCRFHPAVLCPGIRSGAAGHPVIRLAIDTDGDPRVAVCFYAAHGGHGQRLCFGYSHGSCWRAPMAAIIEVVDPSSTSPASRRWTAQLCHSAGSCFGLLGPNGRARPPPSNCWRILTPDSGQILFHGAPRAPTTAPASASSSSTRRCRIS